MYFQGVADMLATHGVKKAQAENALDALADQGKVVRKEFGKTKIYYPSQDNSTVLSPEVGMACETSFIHSSFSHRHRQHTHTHTGQSTEIGNHQDT